MYGVYFSLAGTLITVAGNILLLPVIGYFGSVISMLTCYLVMCFLAYFYGQKNYPIPYNYRQILIYCIIASIISIGSFYVKLDNFVADSLLNISITILFVLIVYLIEWKKLNKNPA